MIFNLSSLPLAWAINIGNALPAVFFMALGFAAGWYGGQADGRSQARQIRKTANSLNESRASHIQSLQYELAESRKQTSQLTQTLSQLTQSMIVANTRQRPRSRKPKTNADNNNVTELGSPGDKPIGQPGAPQPIPRPEFADGGDSGFGSDRTGDDGPSAA